MQQRYLCGFAWGLPARFQRVPTTEEIIPSSVRAWSTQNTLMQPVQAAPNQRKFYPRKHLIHE